MAVGSFACFQTWLNITSKLPLSVLMRHRSGKDQMNCFKLENGGFLLRSPMRLNVTFNLSHLNSLTSVNYPINSIYFFLLTEKGASYLISVSILSCFCDDILHVIFSQLLLNSAHLWFIFKINNFIYAFAIVCCKTRGCSLNQIRESNTWNNNPGSNKKPVPVWLYDLVN